MLSYLEFKRAFILLPIAALFACGGGGDKGDALSVSDRDTKIDIVLEYPMIVRAPGPVSNADVLLIEVSKQNGVDLAASSIGLKEARERYESKGALDVSWSELTLDKKAGLIGGVPLALENINPQKYYLVIARGGAYFDPLDNYGVTEFDQTLSAYIRGKYLLTGIYLSEFTDLCAQKLFDSADPKLMAAEAIDKLLDDCSEELISKDHNNDGAIDYEDLLKKEPATNLPASLKTVTGIPDRNQRSPTYDLFSPLAEPSNTQPGLVINNVTFPGKNYNTPHNGTRIKSVDKGYPTWITMSDDGLKVGDWILIYNVSEWYGFDGAVIPVIAADSDRVALDVDSSFYADYRGNGLAYWLGPLEITPHLDSKRFAITAGNLDALENRGWAGVLQYNRQYSTVSAINSATDEISLDIGAEISDEIESAVLYARHRQPLGQHYSPWGNMAYAHRVGQAIESFCTSELVNGVFLDNDKGIQSMPRADWQVLSGSTSFDLSHVRNQHNPGFGTIHSFQRNTIRFNSFNKGAGIRYSIPAVDIDRTFVLSTAIYSLMSAAVDFQGSLSVYLEGSEDPVFEKMFALENVYAEFDVAANQVATLFVEQVDDLAINREFRVSDLAWYSSISRTATDQLCANNSSRILLLGDSWFEASEYPGFKNALQSYLDEKSLDFEVIDKLIYQQKIIKTGEAGTTVKKGEAWIDTFLTAVQPRFVVINYFTNDANSINGTNLGVSDGPSGGVFSMNVRDAVDYQATLDKIVNKVKAYGAVPIVLTPDVTASSSQTIRHIGLNIDN